MGVGQQPWCCALTGAAMATGCPLCSFFPQRKVLPLAASPTGVSRSAVLSLPFHTHHEWLRTPRGGVPCDSTLTTAHSEQICKRGTEGLARDLHLRGERIVL